jgi:hypothetical protein
MNFPFFSLSLFLSLSPLVMIRSLFFLEGSKFSLSVWLLLTASASSARSKTYIYIQYMTPHPIPSRLRNDQLVLS